MNLKLDYIKNVLIKNKKNLLKERGFIDDKRKESFIRADSLSNKQIIFFLLCL